MPPISVSRTPDFGDALSIASAAPSGLVVAASIERVAARMKRRTSSGLFFGKSLLTTMPEQITLTPLSAKRIECTGRLVASVSFTAWSIT